MGTNCASLTADLFLFCYERYLMMSLSDDKQAYIIDAFKTTSRNLNGDVPRSTYYVSQLIRFARASSHVVDFNTHNKLLTQKLLKQGYRYHKLCKTFSTFYRRYYV